MVFVDFRKVVILLTGGCGLNYLEIQDSCRIGRNS